VAVRKRGGIAEMIRVVIFEPADEGTRAVESYEPYYGFLQQHTTEPVSNTLEYSSTTTS